MLSKIALDSHIFPRSLLLRGIFVFEDLSQCQKLSNHGLLYATTTAAATTPSYSQNPVHAS